MEIIIQKFNDNIKDKEFIQNNEKHNGQEGHWLETQMNIKHNNKNEPDLLGYEMKKYSKKITLGDFSASEYLFSPNKTYIKNSCSRDEFIKYFGTYKENKKRYSWSGFCFPKIDSYNDCGQIIIIENENICIYYSFEKDKRENKIDFPDFLKNDKVLIALWLKTKIETHINNKFNVNGFFLVKKTNNKYSHLEFGKPFDYNVFLTNFKNGNIFLDSGMKTGNNRNYSHFRTFDISQLTLTK